jgi:hypothetical protein
MDERLIGVKEQHLCVRETFATPADRQDASRDAWRRIVRCPADADCLATHAGAIYFIAGGTLFCSSPGELAWHTVGPCALGGQGGGADRIVAMAIVGGAMFAAAAEPAGVWACADLALRTPWTLIHRGAVTALAGCEDCLYGMGVGEEGLWVWDSPGSALGSGSGSESRPVRIKHSLNPPARALAVRLPPPGSAGFGRSRKPIVYAANDMGLWLRCNAMQHAALPCRAAHPPTYPAATHPAYHCPLPTPPPDGGLLCCVLLQRRRRAVCHGGVRRHVALGPQLAVDGVRRRGQRAGGHERAARAAGRGGRGRACGGRGGGGRA